MTMINKPGRYAVDADGRLYACRGRWRVRAVAVVTVRPKPVPAPARTVIDFPGIGPIPDPVPYVPGKKINLRGVPSSMETLAASWREKRT